MTTLISKFQLCQSSFSRLLKKPQTGPDQEALISELSGFFMPGLGMAQNCESKSKECPKNHLVHFMHL